jgi:hypothetical protein
MTSNYDDAMVAALCELYEQRYALWDLRQNSEASSAWRAKRLKRVNSRIAEIRGILKMRRRHFPNWYWERLIG